MWKQVCEAWYSEALNVLEELNIAMPRILADKVGATKYWLYNLGVQAYCCVFIGMNLSMLLCFHWNEFKYVVVFSLECI